MKIIYEDNYKHALILDNYDLLYIMNEFKVNGKDLREAVEHLYKQQFGQKINSSKVWIYYDKKEDR